MLYIAAKMRRVTKVYGCFSAFLLIILVLFYVCIQMSSYQILPMTDNSRSVIDKTQYINLKPVKTNLDDSLIDNIIYVASSIASKQRTVLVTVLNDAYLQLAYSWLCNTKDFGIHTSVLIITSDNESKSKLNRDWPDVNVVFVKLDNVNGNQSYSRAGYLRIMVKRTEILLQILLNNIELFLFEMDFVWFVNPLEKLKKRSGHDFLLNPVSGRTDLYCGGLIYMFPTHTAKLIWNDLTERMIDLEKQFADAGDNVKVSESTNDQTYFSQLINSRHYAANVGTLALQEFADGKWYSMTNEEQHKSHPLIIHNNWIIGNDEKIRRAKKWNHWFLRDDWTCNTDLVQRTVQRI